MFCFISMNILVCTKEMVLLMYVETLKSEEELDVRLVKACY